MLATDYSFASGFHTFERRKAIFNDDPPFVGIVRHETANEWNVDHEGSAAEHREKNRMCPPAHSSPHDAKSGNIDNEGKSDEAHSLFGAGALMRCHPVQWTRGRLLCQCRAMGLCVWYPASTSTS